MRVELSEKEAQKRIIGEYGSYIDPAVFRAVKAALGLEFAPEPKLPERLTPELSFGKPNWCWLNEAGERVLYLSLSLTSSDKTQKEIVTAAFERASAYPGLRLAVEREIEQILHHHTLQHPYRTDALVLIADRLRAELAKGPK